MPTEKTYRRHKPQPTPIKKLTETMCRNKKDYCNPEIERYFCLVEAGFLASYPEIPDNVDKDFEYEDGGDAW